MATVKEIKATVRPRAGKGASRVVRREGRVPGVIYGGNQPPLNISLDHAELRQRIYAGKFLSSIYDIDVDGTTQRVIPRDFHLDPVRDQPVHVDFMRLTEGAPSGCASHPCRQRGNIARRQARRDRQHRHPYARCAMPGGCDPGGVRGRCIDARDQPFLAFAGSQLPPNVRPFMHGDATLVTIVPPSGYAEEIKAAASAAATAAATPAAAPAAAGGAAGAGGGDKKGGDKKADKK